MSVRRIFINWSQPILPQVAASLVASQSHADFSEIIAVFPGRQAGRRFLELLTEQAGGSISPPRIVTMGALPELLYSPKRPFASSTTQKLAWVRALRSLPADDLAQIIHVPPESDDTLGWIRLGELLTRQHVELAGDRLRFADVAQLGPRLSGFDEQQRWQALANAQQRYLSILDELQLWDLQTARLVAIEKRECQTAGQIITVGAVDLSRTLRAMLAQVSSRVTAFIHAPDELAARFDEIGCLIPAAWEEECVELRPEQVLVREDPGGQCQGVLSSLQEISQDYALGDITIAVPDETLLPRLQGALNSCHVPTFHPVERLLPATGPYRLLESVAAYLDGQLAVDFAALIRHPDLSAWLDQHLAAEWLMAWDTHVMDHLPRATPMMVCDTPEDELAIQLRDQVHKCLEPFFAGLKPLADWSGSIIKVLETIYDWRSFETSSPAEMRTLRAIQAVAAGFDAHASIPAALDAPLSASEALRLTLHELSGEALYHTGEEPAVQLFGWLELPLDDAPVSIVTSFNEGFIPSALNHDLFLPDCLRTHLGIEDNSRRYARDLHALLSIANSRKHLRVISARRDGRNDPLAPSRLLLAAEPEESARRILDFYQRRGEPEFQLGPRPGAISTFQIPPPQPLELPLTKLRVTAFRDFLASPYRFYLQHVLRLEEVSDDARELDGAAFGTMLHEVLRTFGEGDSRHLTSRHEIERQLHHILETCVQSDYGTLQLSAVRVQVEQARLRLTAFARWQAEWRAQGWQIYGVERQDAEPVPLILEDGRILLITGRIDRIDYHPESGEWFIFDYKTAEKPADPESFHRKGPAGEKRWVDLQLPLYRHLARALHVDGKVRLGYLSLPRNAEDAGVKEALWTTADLDDADALARRIARSVLDQEFWLPLQDRCTSMTQFDDVCLQDVSGYQVLV